MPHTSLVPKQRTLTETESPTSFEAWKESMIFHITLDNKSARFLSDLKTWTTAANRGFTDDAAGFDEDTKMNGAAKAALLNIILGSVSTYAPVISHRFVKQQSTSLESIWDRLRSHYGLRRTGASVLELMEFRLEPSESREALWEHLYSYMEDNLLLKDGGVKHEGVKPETDEQFTPTLLNVLVTCWLNILNPSLPSLVRQRFSTQLREATVYSIREEISDAIPTLIAEMEEREGIISRTGGFQRGKFTRNKSYNSNKRSCCLCEEAGRPSTNHFLSACPFLPPEDKRFWSKPREVVMNQENEEQFNEEEGSSKMFLNALSQRVNLTPYPVPEVPTDVRLNKYSSACSRKVDIVPAPVLGVVVNAVNSYWTLDCGAETNII